MIDEAVGFCWRCEMSATLNSNGPCVLGVCLHTCQLVVGIYLLESLMWCQLFQQRVCHGKVWVGRSLAQRHPAGERCTNRDKGRELSSFRSQSIRSIEVETITEARALLDVLVLQIVAESCAIDASLIAFLCRDHAVQSNRQTSHDQSSAKYLWIVILLRVIPKEGKVGIFHNILKPAQKQF